MLRSILACCLLLPLTIAADDGLLLAHVDERVRADADRVTLELDPAGYHELWTRGQGSVRDFPLTEGRRVDLELSAFNVLAPDAKVVDVGPRGERVRPRPQLRFLRGEVVGEPGSRVVLTLFDQRLSGTIELADGAWGIGPRAASLAAAAATTIDVWKRESEGGAIDCAVDDGGARELVASRAVPADPFGSSPADPFDRGPLPQLLLELAVDSTTEWCATFGNDATAAANWLLAAVAEISALYDAELSMLVEVPFLRTFCGGADPYSDGLTDLGDRGQLLDEVALEWSTNQGGVARTVTHLFTRADTPANTAGGLASTVTCAPDCTDVLCDTGSGYGVTMFPVLSGSPLGFEVQVAAHELGHNHSSPHTNCLQDGAGDWLTTCAINSCGGVPACAATGCYPGPVDTAVTGTLMSTQCDARLSEIDDLVVSGILRGAAEGASCVGAAGLPGESRGLTLDKPTSCPSASLVNDDGLVDSGLGGPVVWTKRFTPACTPFRLTGVDVLIPDFGAAVGRPIRIVVYADPSGSGDPADAALVYSEDTTIQVVSFSAFNSYTLTTPVTIASGDLYLGFLDPAGDGPFLIAEDSSFVGDSWAGGTNPAAWTLDTGHTYMIRGGGGPVPAGSVSLAWDLPCNDATTPGQDYAVYLGDIGVPDAVAPLTCSTRFATSYLAEDPGDDRSFLIVPGTTPSEGSYGTTSLGGQRPPSANACKTQALELCP